MLLLNIFTEEASSQKTPMFYGWFFDEIIADGIKRITDNYLSKLYTNAEEVQGFLKNVSTSAGIKDPLQYYTKPDDPNTGEYDPFYHITTFYCGVNDCSRYSGRVAQYLNHIFITHLVGVYFTPRTYGIRVNLTSIQKEIFEIDDLDDLFVTFNEREDPCESEILNGIQLCPQDDSNFHPTDTRAHVTLGCAPNISAVVTGLDLIEILKLEMEPNQFCTYVQLDEGNLIQMGENCDTFVYYLKEKMVANSTFQVYYNNSSKTLVLSQVQRSAILFFIFLIYRNTFLL